LVDENLVNIRPAGVQQEIVDNMKRDMPFQNKGRVQLDVGSDVALEVVGNTKVLVQGVHF
jgi:hypothetical protein